MYEKSQIKDRMYKVYRSTILRIYYKSLSIAIQFHQSYKIRNIFIYDMNICYYE